MIIFIQLILTVGYSHGCPRTSPCNVVCHDMVDIWILYLLTSCALVKCPFSLSHYISDFEPDDNWLRGGFRSISSLEGVGVPQIENSKKALSTLEWILNVWTRCGLRLEGPSALAPLFLQVQYARTVPIGGGPVKAPAKAVTAHTDNHTPLRWRRAYLTVPLLFLLVRHLRSLTSLNLTCSVQSWPQLRRGWQG